MIKNLIWDVDGTLFDTYPAIVSAFHEALQSYGKSAPAGQVDMLARVGLSICAARLADQFNLDQEELADRFGEYYSKIPQAAQPPFEGVEAVCRAVLNLGGANMIVTHRARKSTEELLSMHGLQAYFSDIVAGDEGLAKKPDPAGFLEIIRRHKLDPSQTAAVGDREIDILAGKAAGLITFWFCGPPSTLTVDLAFTDYRQLLAYLAPGLK